MNSTNRIVIVEYYLVRGLKFLAFLTLVFFSVITFIKGFDSTQSEIASIICFIISIIGFLSTLINYVCVSKDKVVFQKNFHRTIIKTKEVSSVPLETSEIDEVFIFKMKDGKIKKIKIGQFYESDKIEIILRTLVESGELIYENKKSVKNIFMKIYVKLVWCLISSILIALAITSLIIKLLLKNYLMGASKFCMTLFVGVFYVSVFLIVLHMFVNFVINKYK